MLRNRLVSHVVFLSSGAAVSSILAYLFRITCVHSMSVEDYGKLALFLMIYSNLIIVAFFNMGATLTKYVSEYRVKDESNVLSLYASAIIIAFFTSLIAFAASMVVYTQYNLLSIAIAVCLFLSFSLFAIHRINAGILQGYQKMGQAGILTATTNVFRLVLLIAFIFIAQQLSIESALLAYFLGIYLTSVLSLFLALRILKVKWSLWKMRLSGFIKQVRISNIKLIVSFSGYTVLRDVLSLALGTLIPAFILSRTDFANVAYLDIALTIYSGFSLVLSSLGITLLSEASKREGGGTPLNYRNILHRLMKYSLFFVAIIYILFWIGADTLFIRLIFGEDFLPSASPLHILLLSFPFSVYNIAAFNFIMAAGNPKATLKIVIFTFLISLPLYIVVLVVMEKGINGAAAVSVVSQMLFSIFLWRELRKDTYVRELATG